MSDKKTTTNSHSAQTATTTPNVPQWGVDSLQNLNTSINGIAAADPQSFVTGPSQLQNQAYYGAGILGGNQGVNAQAEGTAHGLEGGILPDLSKYMNPYTNDVVNTTLQGFDQNTAKTQAQMQAAAARTSAFGGSRYGVAQGDFAAQSGMDRAQAEAQLRDQAFNTGAGLATTDAGTKLAAANTASNIANNDQAQLRAGIALQDQLGGEQRDLAQQKATAGVTRAQVIAALLNQNQLGLMTGSTTNGTGTSDSTQTVSDPMGAIGGILNGIGSAAQGAGALGKVGGLAAMFSDVRLKRDIKTEGHDAKGRRRVSWRYLWDGADADPHHGFIAQELLATDPHAVHVGPGGFLMVDYGAL